MGSVQTTKINHLFTSHPAGIALQSSWLSQHGYSHDLQKRYRKSNWLTSIGTGAMIRTGDLVGYEGGIYALQQQSGLTVHPGGRTALALLGNVHYLELSAKKTILFGGNAELLPAWFKMHDWGVALDYHTTSFLPPEIGMIETGIKNFSINISGPIRAFMECLYLAPRKQDLMECLEIIEGMNNLRPNQVQELLEKCSSIKVKRLFLYFAEKAGHEWFKYLDLGKIDLGRGKRSIVKNGVYIDKYMITVPKAVDGYGKRDI